MAAVWGSIRALMPGGGMDRGYANVGKAMAPLGFEVTERPSVNIDPLEEVTVEGCAKGITVVRKGGEQADWLCDLWLAERLAEC